MYGAYIQFWPTLAMSVVTVTALSQLELQC